MTRVAVLGPPHAGLEWWGIAETGFSTQKGPKHLTLRISLPYGTVSGWETDQPPPRALVEHLEVRFRLMHFVAEGETKRRWTAVVDGNIAACGLLNIAYTCPDTHVDWRAAKHLRDHFERIMGGFGG